MSKVSFKKRKGKNNYVYIFIVVELNIIDQSLYE